MRIEGDGGAADRHGSWVARAVRRGRWRSAGVVAAAAVALAACGDPGDGGTAAVPAGSVSPGGPPPVVLPAGPGGEPVALRFVETRRLLDLDADAEAAVVHRCVPGNNGRPVSPDGDGRLLVAVGSSLVLVQNSQGLAACLVELVSRDGPPDFSWSDKPMLRWWHSDRTPDFSRPPEAPIEVFNTSTREEGVVDWAGPTWFWHAFGRVSPEVKELFAVIPNGEAINVPVGATGAFALYWNRTVDTPEQVQARPPLSLFARDGAGRVLHSVTLP
ncbi:hypothetical protein [Pseudofrankia sp. BMG5.37]|uniref:hypothetical protein n=1 Tax=Pseudofrankia sp. BMG5.37 TaxID=3050035 RepID=UPI0028948148|nr:hypothetical protein [Pseudofrankia sp. BMG5.37]MDT3443561.1 hypothetical protein [Pseudofrankia sp. BMG5.37]